MNYTLSIVTDAAQAALVGRFTFEDHQIFRQILDKIPSLDRTRFVLDLAAVEFIDSAALGMLLLASDACRKAGISFGVRGARGQVRRTLEIADLGSVFQLVE